MFYWSWVYQVVRYPKACCKITNVLLFRNLNGNCTHTRCVFLIASIAKTAARFRKNAVKQNRISLSIRKQTVVELSLKDWRDRGSVTITDVNIIINAGRVFFSRSHVVHARIGDGYPLAPQSGSPNVRRTFLTLTFTFSFGPTGNGTRQLP